MQSQSRPRVWKELLQLGLYGHVLRELPHGPVRSRTVRGAGLKGVSQDLILRVAESHNLPQPLPLKMQASIAVWKTHRILDTEE